ncbi:hypothetical protein NA56DRAFT_713419 [Hyaloscypha hepaticicola]|uniref:Uncharacterized protein n=1 Tax=Hyaloscypha hepaticicola TaxID=2082293 RepID=A0A2J6PDP8_9HELO|nr:hypothetical protein NA56DRAFT_713419 [Hyaloscypha hepaticicola]
MASVSTRDLPEYHTLDAWLQEQKSSIRVDDIEVVLGETADQFFARSNDSYRWKGLHPALDAKLKNYSRDPSTKAHVALGLGMNFLLYDSDVLQALWAVPLYPSLDSILADWNENTSEKGNITYASLNQFEQDQYFIIFEKGEVHWKLPTAWASQVQEFIDFYQKELAEEQRRASIAALDDKEPLALTSTRTGRARRGWGIIPRGRKAELLNVFLGVFGAGSGIVQIALAVAPMCTIL